MTTDLLISNAIAQHKAGKLDEAESIYRQILSAQPDHAEALHMQGLVAHQRGLHSDAVCLIERSLALNPGVADPWNNFGEALRAIGETDRALAAYRRALEIRPQYPEALNNLAVVHEARGELEPSRELLERALGLRPGYGSALNNLGNVLRRLGRHAEARTAYERGLSVEPTAALHNNLGLVLIDLGQVDLGIAHLERAIALKRDYGEAHNNLGVVYLKLGKTEAAMARFELALVYQPKSVDALVNSARTLIVKNRREEAAARLREALALRPRSPDLMHELGCLQLANHHEEDAIELFRAALAIDPNHARSYNDLGNALKNMGLVREGLAAYRESVRIWPNQHGFHSNIAVAVLMDDQATEGEVYRVHRDFGEAVVASMTRPAFSGHRNKRDPKRRLRIAYVGPEFRRHILMQSVLPVIQSHDRKRFEVQVFAHVPEPDKVTEEVKAAVDRYTPIHMMDDDAAAEAIHAAEIDILIHPMGHWANNRLPILARKPAPLQVSYLCNGPTTGIDTVDALIVDPWLDPERRMKQFVVEEPLQLPSGFMIMSRPPDAKIDPEPPSRRIGQVTFGSFNNPSKLTDRSFKLWVHVLDAIPDSRLLLKYHSLRSDRVKERLLDRMAAHGIDRERVVVAGPDHDDAVHLAAFNRVDIVLDTVPFTGGRTTIDALWMGVPVVTRVETPMWSRLSFSHLSRVGLQELAVHSDDEYVELVAALARDPKRLSQWRATLRDRVLASSLMNAPAHTKEFESALRALWRRWCAAKA